MFKNHVRINNIAWVISLIYVWLYTRDELYDISIQGNCFLALSSAKSATTAGAWPSCDGVWPPSPVLLFLYCFCRLVIFPCIFLLCFYFQLDPWFGIFYFWQFFLSFPTIDGRLCSSFQLLMVVSAALWGFVQFTECWPFITAFFGRFDSLDGPGHLFDPFLTVTRISMSFLYVFL